MSGRPNWYYDHSPACTCAMCMRDRRSLRRRPLNRRRHSPAGERNMRTRRRLSRRRRRRTGRTIVWMVLLTVLAMALAYVIVNGDLESDIGALLGLQFGTTPTPAPVAALVTDTPTPTATLTPLVPTPSTFPTPTLTPTQEPEPSPTHRAATTPVPIPTPTPPKYSIDDVDVKLSTTIDATTTVDFTVSMRKLGIGPDTNPVELLMAVDGGEAEMVAIIPGLTSRDAESFVFSREFSPGEYAVTISVADATLEVPVEVPEGTVQAVPPSATPEAIVLAVSPTPAPTEVPTVTPIPTAKPTPSPTIAPTLMPKSSPVVARRTDPTVTPEPSITPTPANPTATVLEAQPTRVPTSRVTATPPRPTKTPTLKYPGDSPLDRNEVENWVFRYTNQEREKAGLRPFIHDPVISEIAQAHSENMVKFGLGHTVQGSGPTDRALAAGYDCRAYRSDDSYSYGLSENIARHPRVTRWSGSGPAGGRVTWKPVTFHIDSQAMAGGLVEGWMNSPGHRANILDSDARRLGVGVAIAESTKSGWVQETVFATQNFSKCS